MQVIAVRTVGPGDRMHRRLMKDRSGMFSGCANASPIGKRWVLATRAQGHETFATVGSIDLDRQAQA